MRLHAHFSRSVLTCAGVFALAVRTVFYTNASIESRQTLLLM
jgi:hypothetical protein